MLTEAVGKYLQKKRATGLRHRNAETYFREFCRSVGDIDMSGVTTQHVVQYLQVAELAPTAWQTRYLLLTRLFEYWAATGEMRPILMPPQKPRRRSTFVPYILSTSELQAIVKAASTTQQHPLHTVEMQTIRTFLVLLYASGAKLRELLALTIGDLDLVKRQMTVTNGAYGRTRTIPLGTELVDFLKPYRVRRRKQSSLGNHLFVNNNGEPLRIAEVTRRFVDYCNIAGVNRRDGLPYQPRLSDFRPSFAVHRINAWISDEVPLDRMLPALSTYLGFANIESVEKYLCMAPSRFSKPLFALSPHKGKKRWRDDSPLMQFLANL